MIRRKEREEIDLLQLLGKDFAVLNREEIEKIYIENNLINKLTKVEGYEVNHNALILFIKEGDLEFKIFDEGFEVEKGNIMILPINSARTAKLKKIFMDSGRFEFECIFLSPKYISKYLIPSSISASFISVLKRDPLKIDGIKGMEGYIKSLRELYEASNKELKELEEYLIVQSVFYIIKKINEYLIKETIIHKSDRKDELINRLHDLFLENPMINYNIEEYCKKLFTSRYLLNKATKELKGVSTRELINTWLMNEIKRDLLTTNLIIKEIGMKYGFSESTNFSKFFKRNEGLSVREFFEKYNYNNS
ncbi:hypothetical protein UJ101_02521 [Flavobacteriaceae bacterium UJ101]|nr:hypothetical protein UJ101_02521 [Flavobacteriaceae bacterium UJ101]